MVVNMDKISNYAFIDSQNLNLAIQSQGWKLDYKKFRIYLKDKHNVSKAFIFIGYVSQYQNLYTSLQQDGFIVVFKPTLILPNGKVKGNVDAELVLHAMIEFPNYYKAVIVTGDGDFFCLVDYLMAKNKLHKLLIPDKNRYSSLLRRFANNTFYMNELRNKLEHK